MTLEVEAELAERLRLLARARGEPLESLAADLLHRGWTQVMRCQQAEEALAGLTPRQGEVARLAAAGRTNRQIARELWLSPETVKTHLRRALEHFDLHSKAELRLLLFALSIPEGIELDGGRASSRFAHWRGPPEEAPRRDALPGSHGDAQTRCADATKREADRPRG